MNALFFDVALVAVRLSQSALSPDPDDPRTHVQHLEALRPHDAMALDGIACGAA